MQAKTNGKRLVVLNEGTHLVPTHDYVTITQGESTCAFTARLIENGEIVTNDVTEDFPSKIGDVTQTPITVDTVDTEREKLHKQLMRKSEADLRELASAAEVEVPADATKSVIADLLVANEYD